MRVMAGKEKERNKQSNETKHENVKDLFLRFLLVQSGDLLLFHSFSRQKL